MRTAAPSQQAYTLPPDKYQAAMEFNRQIDALYFVSVAWSIVVLLVMMRLRAGERLRRFGAWSVPVLLAMPWISSLPFSVYRHHLGLFYGLSVEPWAPWLWDWLKAGAISLAIGATLTVAAFAVVRRWPARWWLLAWAGSVALMVGGTYAAPLVFDPLFHSFTPLAARNPELIAPIQAVAAAAGQSVPPERIFEMDASQKTRTLNAYMTGFGGSRRIVIWDTAVKRLTAPQIQTVFAHELGHHALGHIPRSIGLASAGLLLVFFLLRRWRADDYSTLPKVLLLVTLAAFFAEPVVNTYSRWQEHQADVYELRLMSGLVANAGENTAQVDQVMAEISLDDPAPNPFIEFWLYDHPSTNDRMSFARAWK